MSPQDPMTREKFVQNVRSIVLERAEPDVRARLEAVKILYGSGAGMRARGVTFFGAWASKNGGAEAQTTDLVEICAVAEESPVQLAGTTIHELAHCLAGYPAGHGPEWRKACDTLGLRLARAAGHRYTLSSFAPGIRARLAGLFRLADGSPNFAAVAIGAAPPRPCGAAIGTRGGKSRGKGSGSRLRLWECACTPPIKIRVARDELDVTCNACGLHFIRQ